jgi:UDP-galactopyranose mutase
MKTSSDASQNPRAEQAASLTTMPWFECLEETFDNSGDLVCFSHLRWNFVYQRPQHLMTRCARERRVFFVEEPVFTPDPVPWLNSRVDDSGVCIVVPQIPEPTTPFELTDILADLIDGMFAKCRIHDAILWYYTPMARSFTRHLRASATIYDCMDELSLFRGAPPSIKTAEAELLAAADVVFTGGVSLYEAKKHSHSNIHPVPSSIDIHHFRKSRTLVDEPPAQSSIPHPRLGFAGVIDERFDAELLDALALAYPKWHFVILGPIVKIDPAILPQHQNIHYLGQRAYGELPDYFAGWDVALMPFARNESTRYISPTKTPEYLAAGRPVVSTSIRDVVRPYGQLGLVRIADAPNDFGEAISQAIREHEDLNKREEWLRKVDSFLGTMSWDHTWSQMMSLLNSAIAGRQTGPQLRMGTR